MQQHQIGLIPDAVAGALTEAYADRFQAALQACKEPIATLAIFCPERACVAVGLARQNDLLSWIVAPAGDVADAEAIADALGPFFAQLAAKLGHFDAAAAISKASQH